MTPHEARKRGYRAGFHAETRCWTIYDRADRQPVTSLRWLTPEEALEWLGAVLANQDALVRENPWLEGEQ